MTKIQTLIIGGLLAILPLIAAMNVSAESPATGLRISEVKLGGSGEPKEFVELYNDSPDILNLEGVQLEYAKPSFDANHCQATSWKVKANPASVVTAKNLTGSLNPYGFLVTELSLTDNSSGSLRIIANTPTYQQLDLIGWGDTSSCFVGKPAAIPLSGQVIKRNFTSDGHLVVNKTPDNSVDFVMHAIPLPGDDHCLHVDCSDPEEIPPSTQYAEIIISELLPDPVAPLIDSSDEFIELYNPHNDPVNLDKYMLYSASQATTYKVQLDKVVIEPQSYRAFYSKDTKLSLVNGKAGYVWLTSPGGTIVGETDWYPDDLTSGQAWALTADGWKITDTPTPREANIIELVSKEEPTEDLLPCGQGKYRNPETGRCKNLDLIVSAIQPCKPGQVRSSETNRCRNIVQAASGLAACKSGQVRNPDTGRCRNVVSASAAVCATGYERNAETNRCRKVAAASKPPPHPEDKPTNNKINLAILGGISTMLLGYACYEYRRDLFNVATRLRTLFVSRKKEMLQ